METAGLGEGPYAPKPSITNIIHLLDEGFLPGYYAKLVAEHAVQNLDTIKANVTKFGPDLAIGALKAVPAQPHPNGPIGDEVHDAIDAMIHGRPATPLTTVTARNMFAQFQHFMAVEKPEVIQTEFTVWSYKYGYAGTGDLLWVYQGALWIVDTKTGQRIWPKVAMQDGALANADVILDADGNEHPMPKATRFGCLHIRPRSAKLFELDHVDEAFKAFLGLKAAFDWGRFYKAGTIPAEPLARTEYKAA